MITSLESYQLCCHDCSTWYSNKEVDENTPCPACNGQLQDSSTYQIQTPYMEARAKLVKAEIASLQSLIADLEYALKTIWWEE